MKFPFIGIAYIKIVRIVRFWPERFAYRGLDSSSGNGKPSIVFFTHYRCASMMLMKRLLDLVEGRGYLVRDYQGLVHPWPIPERDRFQRDLENHEKLNRFNKEGRFFGPLRYFVNIPNLPEFQTIVVLRDPRDVLVSRYYSEKFAHVRLDSRFLAHCRRVEEMDLDEFVIHFKDDVGSHYRFFMEHWESLSNALVVPYEKVIEDFEGFLTMVNEYLSLGKSEGEIAAIASKESFTVAAEDRYAHKRNVAARNFEKKLKPETIETLNEALADILDHFGWEN